MLPLLLAHGIRSLQVERERGITVKAQSASMLYTHYPTESPIGESLSQADSPTGTLQPSAQRTHTDSAPSASSPSSFSTPPPPPSLSPPTYLLNLIDTPGHVDFSYEVSRALAAAQGVLLLVDAEQGVQAQTLANFYLARNAGLAVVPVINKIDRPNANPQAVAAQVCGAAPVCYTAGSVV